MTAAGAEDLSHTLERLAATIEARRGAEPAESYVASLLARGSETLCKKVGEEATETVIAATLGDRDALTREMADLWFHCLVLLVHNDLGPADVVAELARREGLSGLVEKRNR